MCDGLNLDVLENEKTKKRVIQKKVGKLLNHIKGELIVTIRKGFLFTLLEPGTEKIISEFLLLNHSNQI